MKITRKIKTGKNKVVVSTLDHDRKPNKRPRIKYYELASKWRTPRSKLV